MKKLFAMILSILLTFTFLGCQSSASLDAKMKEAYISQFCRDGSVQVDQLEIESYGTYDGCTVAYIHGPFGYTGAIENEKVGPCSFNYPSSQKLEAYKDGVYKSLPDAYSEGWLDDEAVKQIWEKHKKEHPHMY